MNIFIIAISAVDAATFLLPAKKCFGVVFPMQRSSWYEWNQKIVLHRNFYFSVASSNISNEQLIQYLLIFLLPLHKIIQSKNNALCKISPQVIEIWNAEGIKCR